MISARKLRPYFNSHPVEVRTNSPLKQIILKPGSSGRMVKWAVELGEYDISYSLRTTIKAQALSDFLIEFTPSAREESRPKCDDDAIHLSAGAGVWKLFVDGASGKTGSGAGLILTDPEGNSFTYAIRLLFPATNNQSEYEALIAGLQLANELKARNVLVHSDSQLVVSQVKGEFEAREPMMQKYLERVIWLKDQFEEFEIVRIPRSQNANADALSKLASSVYEHLVKPVLVETLERPSVITPQVMTLQEESSWMSPIKRYLSQCILPDSKSQARKIRVKAPRYELVDNVLYRKSYLMPLLRCLEPGEAKVVLGDIHQGMCGNHVGSRNLARKALIAGYYWPTMFVDSEELVKRCRQCQVHAPVIRTPAEEMTALASPWPFAQWGIDLLGPFP